MEIHKLNCPSCGAPISVPEDIDFLNCMSCGSALNIRRGEGYVALKIAEKVAQTIRQSSQETQSAIREGTEVTRKEFQRLQYGQDLSMAEMRLTSLRGEIRNAQRETQTPVVAAQIRDLHFQEYLVLSKIRSLKTQLASLDYPDPFERVAFVDEQTALVRGEMAVIHAIVPPGEDTQRVLAELTSHETRLQEKASGIRLKAIKAGLKSYQPGVDAVRSQAGLISQNEIILKDLDVLKKLPDSKEKKQVETELLSRHKENFNRWINLETERIAGLLESIPDRPGEDNLAGFHEAYARVQNDLQKLGTMPSNGVVVSYQKQLQSRAKDLQRKIDAAQKRAAKEAARVAKASAGEPSLSERVRDFIKSSFASSTQTLPLAATPETSRALIHSGIGIYIQAFLLGLIPTLLMSCIGILIYSGFRPVSTTAQKDVASSPATAIPLFFMLVGYLAGVFLFFRRIAPGIHLLPPFPKKMDTGMPSGNQPAGRRIGIFAGLAAIFGAFLLFLTTIVLLPDDASLLACLVLPVGAVISFLYGREIALQVTG